MNWYKVNNKMLIKAKSKEEAQQIYLKENMFMKFKVSEKGYRKIDFKLEECKMKSYVYFYDNESKDLFGVDDPMDGYDYDLATLDELIKQEWANENDEERIFVIAEGEFYYRNGKYIPA